MSIFQAEPIYINEAYGFLPYKNVSSVQISNIYSFWQFINHIRKLLKRFQNGHMISLVYVMTQRKHVVIFHQVTVYFSITIRVNSKG